MLNNPTDTHSYTQKPQYITCVPGCSWSSGCCLFNGLHPEIHHIWVRRRGYPDHIRWCVYVCGGGGCFVNVTFPPTFVTTLSTFLPHVQKQMCQHCFMCSACTGSADQVQFLLLFLYSTPVKGGSQWYWLYNIMYFGSWVACSLVAFVGNLWSWESGTLLFDSLLHTLVSRDLLL